MRVLVTGATGFLGGVLCQRLAALGHDVLALGRSPERLEALKRQGFQTIGADISSAAVPRVRPVDAVAHCAARSSPWARPEDYERDNIEGTRMLLAYARACGARRLVHISTPSLYFRFQDQINVREDAPLPTPVNDYARTKRTAEDLALAATDLDPIVLRPRGLYGPGDTALLPRLLLAGRQSALPLLNGGRAATDLTYVEDVAEAVCTALMRTGPLLQRVFNISGGAALNVRQVADCAAQRAGFTLRWRSMPVGLVLALARIGEAAAKWRGYREPRITAYGVGLFAYSQTLDISAAAAQLGWRPRTSFEEGLFKTFGRQAR
jgi:nucleoside-diphosphate-sugar epimerase